MHFGILLKDNLTKMLMSTWSPKLQKYKKQKKNITNFEPGLFFFAVGDVLLAVWDVILDRPIY